MAGGPPHYRVTAGGNAAGISPAGGGPDNAIARWDGTTLLQGSTWILDDAGVATVNSAAGIYAGGPGVRFTITGMYLRTAVGGAGVLHLATGAPFGDRAFLSVPASGDWQLGVANIVGTPNNIRINAATTISWLIGASAGTLPTDVRMQLRAAAAQLGVAAAPLPLVQHDGAATVLSSIGASAALSLTVGGTLGGGARPGLLLLDGSEVRVFAAGSAIFQRWFTLRTELWQSHRWRTGNGATWDAETLAANKVLGSTLEAQFQNLDCGGANRLVTAPAGAGNNGLWYTIANESDANELLDVQDPVGHIADLRAGGQLTVLTDGTTYRPYFRGVACFGELYLDAASAALLLGVGGTVVTIWDTAGIAADVAVVAAAGTLTPARDAIYDVSFSVSGTGLDTFTFTIFVGGVATHVRAQGQLGLVPTGVFAANGKVMVPAGVAVTLVGAAAAGSLFTFNAAMLNIEKVT